VAATTPGTPTQPGGQSQFGDTVARDLVNALIDLLNVQNDFLSVWVDHDVQRLQLDFDLGIMELDERGVRMEHEVPLRSFLNEAPFPVPCELPDACAPAREAQPDPDTYPSEEDLPVPPGGAALLDMSAESPATEDGADDGPMLMQADASASKADQAEEASVEAIY
jgi:hypothetical protein